MRGLAIHETAIGGGRNVGRAAEIFGETFRAFELGRGFRRTEIADAGLAERVAETRDERRFGADHDQLDVLIAAEPDDGVVVGGIERDALRDFGDAGVSGRADRALSAEGLRSRPRRARVRGRPRR